MDTFQRLLFGFSVRQQESRRAPPGRKPSSANLSNDVVPSTILLPTHNDVQKPTKLTESGTLPSAVRRPGNVSGGKSAIDKAQSMANQSAPHPLARNPVSNANTGYSPSASIAPPRGNTMPNSDIKSYRTGASTSGNLDTRPCGPDSGPRLATKPPAVPSPLYRQNTATQESTPVPRDVAGFHEPNAVPGLTTQPSNFVTPTHQNGTSEAGGMQVPASVHRKDARSRESHTVPSQTMTPRTVASSLRRNGTSDGTTNIGAQMTGSPSPNIPGPHEPDPVLRQTAQSSMVLTSACTL
ncbi:hypothetical protein F5J12DRAFT_343414 [Pisolithus orientalis]|uniref:uncharacterized protein n=1 Tax=Pisolithus orientalis TaxID=936130 RepID=UPI0022245952|nr:uncharacterized protein F5J12DRAFT_343414 [Pisolithus orientalis]KAI5997320.1 hypothetical protein F5J12DRAFT_343414 [Pisolithus orientalis]